MPQQPTRRRRRKNPVKIGSHPDFFVGSHRDIFTRESAVVAEWRDATPDELRKAVVAGGVSVEDLADIAEVTEALESGEDARSLGLSKKISEALLNGLHAELLDLDEKGREKRAEPFIQFMKGRATWHLEYETEPGQDGYNNTVDQFQSDLETCTTQHLVKALREWLDEQRDTENLEIDAIDSTKLEEILRDPANWRVYRHSGHGREAGTVWAWSIGEIHDQCDGTQHDDELEKIVFGGKYEYHSWGPRGQAWERGERDRAVLDALEGGGHRVEIYPGLGQEDLDYAVKELENNEPYVYFDVRHGREPKLLLEDLTGSFDYRIRQYQDDSMVAVPNEDTLLPALREALGAEEKKVGPETDDVVYRYSGSHDSVAGPSGKGMYVARLKPQDLRREGAVQGICIGTENLGHPKALREGRTQVFSIRTPVGKPKFTIEMRKDYSSPPHGMLVAERPSNLPAIPDTDLVWVIKEVKGKGNRLPGFDSGDSNKPVKQDDVRLVTDFLLHLGYEPRYLKRVSDLAPGVTAMLELNIDPFVPLPRKIRTPPKENPARLSPRVRALLAKTRPMGRFENAPRKNPVNAGRSLAQWSEGAGTSASFEDFYDRGDELLEDVHEEDVRHGRRVHWIGTDGAVVRVDVTRVLPLYGNQFDIDKLDAVAQTVASSGANTSDGKPIFEMGYGTVQIITEDDVRESQAHADEEHVDSHFEWQSEPLTDADVGQILYTVRDGNHRVFGAIIGGEKNVWMRLYANQLQDVKEWRKGARSKSRAHNKLMKILDEKLRSD